VAQVASDSPVANYFKRTSCSPMRPIHTYTAFLIFHERRNANVINCTAARECRYGMQMLRGGPWIGVEHSTRRAAYANWSAAETFINPICHAPARTHALHSIKQRSIRYQTRYKRRRQKMEQAGRQTDRQADTKPLPLRSLLRTRPV